MMAQASQTSSGKFDCPLSSALPTPIAAQATRHTTSSKTTTAITIALNSYCERCVWSVPVPQIPASPASPACSAAAQENLDGDAHGLVDLLAPRSARHAGEPAELLLADQHVEKQHRKPIRVLIGRKTVLLVPGDPGRHDAVSRRRA